ncbi:hypothetical protein GN244_ATG17807 [Phytophthora infestans]|uniref:Ankyrin repeat protein n=1 Tax=Phytophthora infestans TaxID=4787 RepID=A0A833WKS6_PHYIN|nr:hypothetical protein GN244_ATG17807 [Phytophthora infestans]
MKRPSTDTRSNKSERKKPRLGACRTRYKTFRDTNFPSNLRSLPHVLNEIENFLLPPEEAMVEAASTNQLDWLKSLVDRYDSHVLDAVLLAARLEDIGSLELLTPHMFDSNELKGGAWDVCRIAIHTAAKSRSCDVVRFLLSLVDSADECRQMARTVVGIAAARGYLDILLIAADTADTADTADVELSINSIGFALSLAICGKQSEAAIFLVSRYYRILDLSEGLEKALIYGMGQVADCIYGVITKQDNETPFEDFFVNLAGDGYANAIEFLYRRGHKETKLLGYALDNAVCADQMEVLRMILNTERVTQDRIGETLLIAARHGKFSPVEFLVQNSRISDRQTKKAFENASKLAISNYLFDKLDDQGF